MNLYPAEAVNDDPTVGGFIVIFDSGITKSIAWRQFEPIDATLDAAKAFTVKLIESLIADRCMDEVEGTNWASATAAVQKIIVDWNAKRRDSLRLMAQASPTVQ
jgi:hypothetical protein